MCGFNCRNTRIINMVGYNFNNFTNATKPLDGAFQEPHLLIFYLSLVCNIMNVA